MEAHEEVTESIAPPLPLSYVFRAAKDYNRRIRCSIDVKLNFNFED
jgi:hypothetical protein